MDMITTQPDAALLALGAKFRKAWAVERAAYIASDDDFDTDAVIDAAYLRCSALADQILQIKPETIEGARVVAMTWGWIHYLPKLGEYDGGEEGNATDTRAVHAVLSFLLKDVAA